MIVIETGDREKGFKQLVAEMVALDICEEKELRSILRMSPVGAIPCGGPLDENLSRSHNEKKSGIPARLKN